MSKVFVDICLSLDGYMTPEGMTLENWERPEYKDWGAKWGALMGWISGLQYFRENLKLGPGGERGPVNDMLRSTTERIGANIMGKRMFDAGERSWPEGAPFHTSVFVLTHRKRDPWVRPGGTTSFFVTDGAEGALEQAREAAGGRDVRIAGGPDVIQQYQNLGAIDELEIALAPVLFGGGRRLFENLREPRPCGHAGRRAGLVAFVRLAPRATARLRAGPCRRRCAARGGSVYHAAIENAGSGRRDGRSVGGAGRRWIARRSGRGDRG